MQLFKSKDMPTPPPAIQIILDAAQYEIDKTLTFYETQSVLEQDYDLSPQNAAHNAFSWAEVIKQVDQLKWLLGSDKTLFNKLVIIWKRSKTVLSFLDYLEQFFLIQEQELWEQVLESYPKKLSRANFKLITQRINDIYYFGY